MEGGAACRWPVRGGRRRRPERIGERRRCAVPDPELVERPRRRRFAAEYKLRIVREADRCSRPGEVGALLRREGLYSSLLTEWRRARDSGALEALAPKRRGPAGPSPAEVEAERLRRRLARSEAELETARRVIEVQGNVRPSCAPRSSTTSRSSTTANDATAPSDNAPPSTTKRSTTRTHARSKPPNQTLSMKAGELQVVGHHQAARARRSGPTSTCT